MAKPLVSIITPTYNSEKFISETIQSVQNQTYPYWEMLIADDASSDDTRAIVSKFQQEDSRIKLIPLTKNRGAGYARNKAINMSSGRYIAFLDGDDCWKPEKLEKQVTLMEDKNITVCFSSYDLMDENSNPLGKTITALEEVDYAKMLKSNYVGNLTGMYNAEVLGKVYMPLIRKRQDWGLWLSCIKEAGKAVGILESLAYYRVRKDSISANKFNLLKHNYNFYRKALNFGVLKSSGYLTRFLIEHFLVKSKQTTTQKS
ncbi:hypothetical protein SAMN05216480_101137 [Pustulibacterium marinum]|uniref:Glycosyltransferase 2-like domain-containing protein n=1 Tax=Pustulibacterium marinum TaxID=1224947 RepID=A0A1I7ETU6_9FLAO|nr:glycosyltransferase family 2 protein [Pustulibacterium marinum]SFU27323.1 hypothetical protein SAMN05216480_101137 [Pustulibacterium marinum]